MISLTLAPFGARCSSTARQPPCPRVVERVVRSVEESMMVEESYD